MEWSENENRMMSSLERLLRPKKYITYYFCCCIKCKYRDRTNSEDTQNNSYNSK